MGKQTMIGLIHATSLGFSSTPAINLLSPPPSAPPSASPSAPPPAPLECPAPTLLEKLEAWKFGDQVVYQAYKKDVDDVDVSNFYPVGYHTAHIAEATDCKYADPPLNCTALDGESGDTNYPFGDIRVLCTVGEYDKKTGHMLVGVPDGMGSYLVDDETVRIVWQSESYGPIFGGESWPFIVNPSGASFTGSHVMYVDYDRALLADFMSHGGSAEGMVKGSGEAIQEAFNLKGDSITKRTKDGCATAPHFSNTDPTGCQQWEGIMAESGWSGSISEPEQADWLMQALCSAHLEEKHQWGPGLGVEDDLFITNEEWTIFQPGSNYTGLPAHVIDLKTHKAYATGVFTLGGFEKIVEFNCGIPGYVCFSPSGYNGAFGLAEPEIRNALFKRQDGSDYAWPQDIVPARVYVGKKGYNAKGEPANDFLSRNGLAYGQLYGFATNVTHYGGRDPWHKTEGRTSGDTVVGKFEPIDWRWDGEVRSFAHDGSWSFQHYPEYPDKDYAFWNAYDYDNKGKKTEHNSPDPRGGPRFIQTSTAGYFGIYEVAIPADFGGEFPSSIPATYTNLQGEVDVVSQIELGGKGRTVYSGDSTVNCDGSGPDKPCKTTFEDIDGFEWIAASDGDYVVIQEDSGNDLGERTFISKVDTTKPMTYYFIAMSGGDESTRAMNNCVPAGTCTYGAGHEFSGVTDLTGLVAKSADGSFKIASGDGHAKRVAEASVPINEHLIAFGLQAHGLLSGVIAEMRGDRGGQVYAYQPQLPQNL